LPSLDQLRSNAAECIRLAEAARTSQHKSLFIEMADRWLTLAEHAAREDRLNGGSLFRDRWVLDSYKRHMRLGSGAGSASPTRGHLTGSGKPHVASAQKMIESK